MIFVTGANGSVGKSFILSAREEHIITAVSRQPAPTFSRVELCVTDLMEYQTWTEKAQLADHIVHLAASRQDCKDKDIYEDVIIAGRLLESWKRGQFVFASSQIVYTESSVSTVNEQSSVSPHNWYGASKLAIENLIQVQHAKNSVQAGFPGGFVIFRLPLVLHASAGNCQFLENLVFAALSNLDFCFDCPEEQAHKYGSSWIGLCDINRAFIHSLSGIASGIYNVHSSYIKTIDALKLVIARTKSKSRVLFNSKGGGIDIPLSNANLDTQKFEATGFTPKECIETILDDFLLRNKLE